jgi:exodeoxyribonuclease VII large subunit
MSGSVELDPDGAHLRIRFAYREDLVAMVKDLPGRRWDPKGKFWRVPASHVEVVFAACSRHLFEFAPEIPSLLAGTLRTVPPPAAERPRGATTAPAHQPALPLVHEPAERTEAPALTVSALNARVRDGLRRQLPEPVWVVGEIVDFDKNANRQHRFFTLVEKKHGESRPHASVEVALFAAAAERLFPALAALDPPLALRDGIEVRLLVAVDLYVAGGRYQVVVHDIDPTFTLGKLALSREQVLRELRQLGVADRNRSLGFPVPALRVGVLTSPDADGWNDFLRHVEDARVGLQLTLFPIKVQGAELKRSLLAGLRWFERHAGAFDVLCIVRGGGSRTDLAGFDDRDVALAVARHPLKVVVGIGHQRDQSVLDAIAHSEKTPTAVAELLVTAVRDARADVGERGRRLVDAAHGALAAAAQRLRGAAGELGSATRARLGRAHRVLAAAGRELAGHARDRLVGEGAALQRAAARTAHACERRLDRAHARLEHRATQLRLLDPRAVLARGFTLVVGADGRIAPSAAGIAAGQRVQVRWRDGHAHARVDDVHRDPQ